MPMFSDLASSLLVSNLDGHSYQENLIRGIRGLEPAHAEHADSNLETEGNPITQKARMSLALSLHIN